MQTRIHIASLMVAGLILQGCVAPPPAASLKHSTVYSTDMVGKAASCTTAPVTVKDGVDNAVALTTGGGGWCGVIVSHDGSPYTVGLLTKPARSGKVYVHTVGDDTRIDYTPDRAPVTADSFAVRLIPGNATIQVSVNTATATTVTK